MATATISGFSSVLELDSPFFVLYGKYVKLTILKIVTGRSSNGRTRPSGGRYLGSNPSLPTSKRSVRVGRNEQTALLVAWMRTTEPHFYSKENE